MLEVLQKETFTVRQELQRPLNLLETNQDPYFQLVAEE
jgi:hypothetical protein